MLYLRTLQVLVVVVLDIVADVVSQLLDYVVAVDTLPNVLLRFQGKSFQCFHLLLELIILR
jgi:hypothetical protein